MIEIKQMITTEWDDVRGTGPRKSFSIPATPIREAGNIGTTPGGFLFQGTLDQRNENLVERVSYIFPIEIACTQAIPSVVAISSK
jgi:hypothetical protein